MDVLGKRDDEDTKKLLAAAEAMKAAGLPVPDSITEQLGADFEGKDPNAFRTVKLPSLAVQPHQEEDRTGVLIHLDKLPKGIKRLMVFPAQKPADESEKKQPPKSEKPQDDEKGQ